MRIYKPTFSKPLPAGAKILTRKDGKFAQFKSGRGKKQETREARLTKEGNRVLVETSHWCIDFEDNRGVSRTLKGFTDREATQRLADTIQKLLNSRGSNAPLDSELSRAIEQLSDAMRRQLTEWRLLEAEQSEIAKPLMELVDKYEQALGAKERNDDHIRETIGMVKEVFEACGFMFWRDIKDHKVENYLRDLREGHVLRQAGKGKKAKPRRVGYRRSNAYLTACKSFCRWVVRRKWTQTSPLSELEKLNEKEDPRHTRRAITVDQLRTLFQKTAEGPERYGMSGYERYLLYHLTVETAMRAGELRRLKKADYNFEARVVAVRPRKASKNKRWREQSLSAGLCAELRDFLSSKLPDAKAFGGSYQALTDQTAAMLKEDLAEAGIPYKDDQGHVFDFHSLRGECASLLIENGADPKQVQEIMRHSTIGLTMDTYAKLTEPKKKAQAIASLPDLSLPEANRQAMLKTGTDGRAVDESLSPACFPSGHMRTQEDHDGGIKLNNASVPPFSGDNQDPDRTENPCVAGSGIAAWMKARSDRLPAFSSTARKPSGDRATPRLCCSTSTICTRQPTGLRLWHS